MKSTDTHSQYIPPPDHIRFDEMTGETTNRGVPMDEPPRRDVVRLQREDDWDEWCFICNVQRLGYDEAKRVLDTVRAMERRWE